MITIKIPNHAFTDNDKKLVPDELLLFMILFKYRNLDNEILTSINILNQMVKLKKGNDRENRPYIQRVLLSLQDKGYINSNLNEETKSDEIIVGTVTNIDKGYCGVGSNVFDSLFSENELSKSKLKLFVYSYIHCFGETGRKVSYEKLSSLLGYFNGRKHASITTVQEVIDEMDGQYIYRFSGERQGDDPKQDANTYFTVLSDEQKLNYQKHITNKLDSKDKRRNEEMIFTCWHADITIGEFKQVIKETNWGKRDDYFLLQDLKYYDYYIYRRCKDEGIDNKFARRCEKAIETIKDRNSDKYDFDLWEQEYLNDRKGENEDIEEQTAEESSILF